ncbi:MAG TPA: endonuclease/exonuclease/phosphatase family protein [Bacteroidia bacterium]|nr:endonuclease/exonuclease/phosphatase family protein [Bacteroidia bacterium]
MKKYFLACFAFLYVLPCYCLSICSWNIENIGPSKSDIEIQFIASVIKNYDVVAIQEVVAGVGGAKAIAMLWETLNRTGNNWDYCVSSPTTGSSYKTERYAFLWKTKQVKIKGKAWLEKRYNLEIDREPYLATFEYKLHEFTLVNFHAITKSKQPESEIKYFKFLPAAYAPLNLIFCGDFNCPQAHTVFNPLKEMGYAAALIGQKTSLKQKCIGNDCLASEYDNFFYQKKLFTNIQSGIISFYKSFADLKEARKISDHVPIFLVIDWK